MKLQDVTYFFILMKFCEWGLTEVIEDANISTKIYFSGEVNRQNRRYWCNEKPNRLIQTKMHGAGKLMV